jgi:hypothetical protein
LEQIGNTEEDKDMQLTTRCCLLATAGVLSCLGTVGCAPQTGAVTGRVIYKDKPVPSGSVVLIDAAGKRHTCVIRADQTFEFKGLAPGLAKLAIVTHDLVPPAFQTSSGRKLPPSSPDAGNGPPQSVRIVLPSKYGSIENSGLTYHVHAGSHSKDIVLPDTP